MFFLSLDAPVSLSLRPARRIVMKPVMVAVDTTPAPIKTFLLCPLQAAHVFRKHANRNLAFSSLDSKDSHEVYAEFHES